jgi:tRNA A37 threonylcarbamoyladenosine synthetase subunit TsaC/SUA5/YrdC
LAGTAPITRVENNHQLEALDVGELAAGPLSTVVVLEGENLTITRVGALTLEALRKVVPTIELANQ